MTTHDQTAVPRSHDEAQTTGAGTPPANEHATSTEPPTAAAEPPPPSSAPPPTVDERREPTTQTAPADSPGAERESAAELPFADHDLADLRARWAGVQAAFVDDPKDCVQKADALVSDLVEQLTTGFAHARSRLEEQWARGEQASTEDLRVALTHYREFFERLLAV